MAFPIRDGISYSCFINMGRAVGVGLWLDMGISELRDLLRRVISLSDSEFNGLLINIGGLIKYDFSGCCGLGSRLWERV
jgi:hypothetical protein